MKKALFFLIILILPFKFSICQTYVSGGIYSNATWTLGGSPYIVTGNVAVFPGVSLTINPGVEIRFNDSTNLVIQHGVLNAIGTSADSITFTSNSPNPYMGIWGGIDFRDSAIININYCNFKYSNIAINPVFYPFALTFIKNSSFNNNNSCIEGSSSVNNAFFCHIDSCFFTNNGDCVYNNYKVTNSKFINNNNGIMLVDVFSNTSIKNCTFCGNINACLSVDTLIDCSFSQNNIGFNGHFNYFKGNVFRNNDTAIVCNIDFPDSMFNNNIYNNHIGIILSFYYPPTSVFNNKICHNTLYNFKTIIGQNANFQNNCWCEIDSSAIAAKIYDGYDDFSLGLISFMPFNYCDTTHIQDTSFCSEFITEINETAINPNLIPKLYPNPFNEYTILEFKNTKDERYELSIYNIFGQLISSMPNITNGQIKIERANMTKGLYIFQLRTCHKIIATGKFIIN